MPKTTADPQNPEEEMAASKSKTTGVLPLANELQHLGKGVYGKQVGQVKLADPERGGKKMTVVPRLVASTVDIRWYPGRRWKHRASWVGGG